MSEPKKYETITDCLIAFGANQGDRENAFAQATELLMSNSAIDNLVASSVVETEPVTGSGKADGADHATDQDLYLNACIRFTTKLTATELHEALIAVETQLGRERKERWGARTIDLDLLIFGDQQMQESRLTIPHPRMSFRRFVLEPANEVAAEMVHPLSGLSIEQLIEHLDTKPAKIVLATDDSPFAEELVAKLTADNQLGDWQVSLASDAMEFVRSAGEAKLVASCFGDEPPADLVRFARNFAGPTLELNVAKGIENCVCELAAAMEAMG